MILRPAEAATKAGGGFLAAWAVIERTQRRAGQDCFVITQPDHAKLSGEIAAAISTPEFPRLEADAIAGIALHDAGWADFDTPGAPPQSFLDADPRQIGAAWTGSIEAAAHASAVAGYLVSRHFMRIAQSDMAANKPEAAALLAVFVQREKERQARLLEQQRFTEQELEVFTDVLQFCDLLSLYLCCGANDDLEFPQRFNGRPVRLRNTPEAFVVEPTPFASPQMFWVRGRRCGSAEESVFAFALR